MTQSLRPRTRYPPPIPIRTPHPQLLPPNDRWKHRCITNQRNHRHRNKRIPLSLCFNPRRDAIINRKTQRVTYKDDGSDEFTAQVTVGGGGVLD